MTKKIHVKYFAVLREQANLSSEELETQADTVSMVYKELAVKYRFSLTSNMVRFAVNESFVAADHPLQNNDRLVFIPPVAGG